MTSESAGYLEFRDRLFRFRRAACAWSMGSLDIQAEGQHCSFKLVAVPFPDANQFSNLPGHVWFPRDDDLADQADVFAEGWFEIRNRQVRVNTARINCKSYNAEKGILLVEFQFEVEDEETGRCDEVEGEVRCSVEREGE